jgi:hypothetical protein
VEYGVNSAGVVGFTAAFTAVLFAIATQPAASINPKAINRVNGTISFIECSITGRMIFFTNSMLQGTEALQVCFLDGPVKSRGI